MLRLVVLLQASRNQLKSDKTWAQAPVTVACLFDRRTLPPECAIVLLRNIPESYCKLAPAGTGGQTINVRVCVVMVRELIQPGLDKGKVLVVLLAAGTERQESAEPVVADLARSNGYLHRLGFRPRWSLAKRLTSPKWRRCVGAAHF